jgi:predicted helicase
MTISEYIISIDKRFRLGNSTEHTFRGDLQNLIESLVPTIRATNEPKRQKCGAPDYILTNKDVPVGFIEAKDIGDNDLDGTKKNGNKEQFDRYKGPLINIIFTDYLNFHLYRYGQFVMKVSIGEVTPKGIKPIPSNFSTFESLISDFCTHVGQTITSSKKLAELMAGKARLLSEVIEKALTSDESNQENSTLIDQMTAFKAILIHDITPKGFADVYAQTITYGLFAARLNDSTLPTFSRQEAFDLIPKSNPFLKKLFGYIAGIELDERIRWIVDDLVQIFLACNVDEMLMSYGKATKMEDPIIHFYEDFLSEYDPKLRKARGVWYTPQPVVNFIVRALDDILKHEFDLKQGLSDTSKTKIKVNVQGKKVEQEVHKVQILDPATGTGTFLAEVVKKIYKQFQGQQGIWSNYVETHLIPRLNGFELLMASYAMAHLKLDLLLSETGYKPTSNQRLRVYLTNSLEESHPDTGTLFASWLSSEANEANHIKRDAPIMCIIGNPPYSGVSSNNGEWINSLIDVYKYVDGVHINERKHWLNDDYVKFIRYGQHYIEKNGSGILAYINPHGFLDNPTFRGMRWHLLKSFDKIYTIDLHGNSKKKETAPDGSLDVNVFDIQQGVSINIFVKTGKKRQNELGRVFHFDLFGRREGKYEFLSGSSLDTINFKELNPEKPSLFFVPKNDDGLLEYQKGIKITDLFPVNNVGFVSANDGLNISFTEEEQKRKIQDILNLDELTWRAKYNRQKDAESWKYIWAKEDADKNKNNVITKVSYRPFDTRYTLYTGKSGGLYARPIFQVMKNFLQNENIGMVFRRQQPESRDLYVFCTDKIISDGYIRSDNKGGESMAPLYIYDDSDREQSLSFTGARLPNINSDFIKSIASNLGLSYSAEKVFGRDSFSPIDIFDYVYAILHSPSYRERYKEFLKIDFPRVPYPRDKETFWRFVDLGSQVRTVHLLENLSLEKFITQYPIAGDNVVSKLKFVPYSNETEMLSNSNIKGSVYINETQYFAEVPCLAWDFYIGGYQPAQKWLKDRKGRKLEPEEILQYQKILVSLMETYRLMNEIDKIVF